MLKKLSLYHYKNYSKRDFEFDENICCFYGPNGAGKTNALDAIYYLCFTKSYFSSFDHQVVQQGTEGMYTKGSFDNIKIDCIVRENGKKEISNNGNLYEKNAEHIGKFPAVIIAPDDTVLINGHSDVRRRFLDILLSQQSQEYLQHLIKYNKYLAQRNALLKTSKNKPIDSTLHDHYKNELSIHATAIHTARKEIITALIPLTQEFYNRISQSDEKIDITYRSQLSVANMLSLLKESAEKDFFTQRTNVGTHKDDIILSINNFPMKQHASQGQKKSFLFSIKLAEYSLLKNTLNKKPILLLDDIFEKLDAQRSQFLVNLILELDTQVFITDTHESRLRNAFEHQEDNIQFEKIG